MDKTLIHNLSLIYSSPLECGTSRCGKFRYRCPECKKYFLRSLSSLKRNPLDECPACGFDGKRELMSLEQITEVLKRGVTSENFDDLIDAWSDLFKKLLIHRKTLNLED